IRARAVALATIAALAADARRLTTALGPNDAAALDHGASVCVEAPFLPSAGGNVGKSRGSCFFLGAGFFGSVFLTGSLGLSFRFGSFGFGSLPWIPITLRSTVKSLATLAFLRKSKAKQVSAALSCFPRQLPSSS